MAPFNETPRLPVIDLSLFDLVARWDGIDLRDVRGTYGEYLPGKVAKVFPGLGRAHP